MKVPRKMTIKLSRRVHAAFFGILAISPMLFCSCRGPFQRDGMRMERNGDRAYVTGNCPEMAAERPPMGPPGMEAGVPLPYAAYPPWSPDGIEQPWPKDEYLRDGGDRNMPAGVGRNWEVKGLEMEDAVAHYDTVDGRTIVEPSNEVHIYSPRFGAVRQVVGLVANEQKIVTQGMTEDVALDKPTHTQLVARHDGGCRAR
jgi:hypothetical protein